jgi:hypothetical protein
VRLQSNKASELVYWESNGAAEDRRDTEWKRNFGTNDPVLYLSLYISLLSEFSQYNLA